MDRRSFLASSAIVGAGAFLPLNIFASLRREFTFQEIRRNVGYFSEKGGTIGWLANDDALIAVDSQYPDTAANCIAELRKKTSRPMDMLINTHHHGDHTGGNPAFKEYAQKIVAHENVPRLQLAAAERNGQEAVDAQVTADTTYSNTWNETVGDEKVSLFYHGPGHTSGDSVVYFEKANVAHMGDLVFNRAYPYIDPGAGASMQNWITILMTTADQLPADTTYIFGHGNPKFGVTGTKEDVLRLGAFLEATIEYVQKGIQAGKSKEEIASLKVMPGFEEFDNPDWFLALDFELNTAYDELTAS